MKLTVKALGVEEAEVRLAALSRKVDPVLRGALNTTGAKARGERFIKPMSKLFKSSLLGRGLSGADMRGKIALKRARSKRMNARLIPSSSGVRVDDYRNWVFEVLSPTRARIHVLGLRGRKVAAGFVNPSSPYQRPLATKSERARNLKPGSKARNQHVKSYRYEKALTTALGPSAAYWFKQLAGLQTIRWTNVFLQQEFYRRIRAEIAKGAR